MWNSDEEIQDVPAEQANRLRMALVEPTSDVGTVERRSRTGDSRSGTGENSQIKWWALAIPVVALTGIAAVHFLNDPATAMADGEESLLDEPFMLAASASPKRSRGKSSDKGFVSGIAHSSNRSIAFVNGEMVSEGDVVDGMTVFKIHKDAVELEKGGKRWTQKVGE